jgi:ATP-dependent Lon protease
MRDFRDAKAMAQTLRDALKTKSVSLTHSESLELIARAFGLHDWNVLAARIEAIQPAANARAMTPSVAAGAVMPAMALRDIVLFPQMVAPIFVGRDKTRLAVAEARASGGHLFAVRQRRSGDDDPAFSDLYSVGVTASVIDSVTLDDNTIRLMVAGHQRATIVRPVAGAFPSAEVVPIEDIRVDLTADILALSRQVLDAYEACANLPRAAARNYLTDPGMLADSIASLLPILKIGTERMQEVLEASSAVKRLEIILQLMKAGRQAA